MQVLSELGRGTYGVVLKVRSLRDGGIYVLKRIRIGHLKPERQREVFKEASVLRRLKHTHVIGYYTSFVERRSLFILMEFAANGDLAALVDRHRRAKSFVPEATLWRVLRELTQALQHLHARCVLHRDIKLGNVFLDENDGVRCLPPSTRRCLPGAPLPNAPRPPLPPPGRLGDLGVSRLLDGQPPIRPPARPRGARGGSFTARRPPERQGTARWRNRGSGRRCTSRRSSSSGSRTTSRRTRGRSACSCTTSRRCEGPFAARTSTRSGTPPPPPLVLSGHTASLTPY